MAELWGTALVRRRDNGTLKVYDFEPSPDETAARTEVATARLSVDGRYFMAVARVEVDDPEPDDSGREE